MDRQEEIAQADTVNYLHEVWIDKEGLTTVCLANHSGDKCRSLLEPGSELIYTYYATGHYESMTIYYQFMNWGEYTTEFEVDKQPCDFRLI